MPQPKRLDPEQPRRRLANYRMERQRPDLRRIFPQVDALDERLFVRSLLSEFAIVEALAPRHRFIDRRAVALEFIGAEQIGYHDEAIALELGSVRRNFFDQSRH